MTKLTPEEKAYFAAHTAGRATTASSTYPASSASDAEKRTHLAVGHDDLDTWHVCAICNPHPTKVGTTDVGSKGTDGSSKKVAIGLVVLFAVAILAVGRAQFAMNHVGHVPDAPAANGGTMNGFGTQDATADVTVGPVGCSGVTGAVRAPVTIVNNSSGRSNYVVQGTVLENGVNVGQAYAIAENVEPGQTATTFMEGTCTGSGAPVTLDLTTVQRTEA